MIINCRSDDDECLTCHADHVYREIASRSMFHWNPVRRIDLLDHLGPISTSESEDDESGDAEDKFDKSDDAED
ncbi:hypothetical protein E8E11_009171 [Didymella keratinophila]|nr:hypothetical protein E8E11_009171 [Didymella keratinophila]